MTPGPSETGLQRLLPSAVILGLLFATSAAFAITERLKLEQSAVYGRRPRTRDCPLNDEPLSAADAFANVAPTLCER